MTTNTTEDDDDFQMAHSTDLSEAFYEFMEMDGKSCGADVNHLRLGFVAGSAAAIMLLGGQIHEASKDSGANVKWETIVMLLSDAFKEAGALLECDEE